MIPVRRWKINGKIGKKGEKFIKQMASFTFGGSSQELIIFIYK